MSDDQGWGDLPLNWPERTMFFELTGRVGVRSGGHKLVSGQLESTRGEWNEHSEELSKKDMSLYDLSSDIAESTDLRQSKPKLYQKMKQETLDYFKSINAEYPGAGQKSRKK